MIGYIALGLTCASVYAFFKGVVFIARHGLPSMLKLRGEAVVEWQDCDQQGRRSTAEWDDHVDSALEILLTHEAGVADGATPERWVALEEEFADLDDLAAQLGERAS